MSKATKFVTASKYVGSKAVEQSHTITETLSFFSTPGVKVVSKLVMNYCLNDISQKISTLLKSDIRVAQSHAKEAMAAFENELFDEVKELWKMSYDESLKGMFQSTTSEMAAYCVNFVLTSKMAIVTFDRDSQTFVEFRELKENIRKNFVDTIKQKIDEFEKHVNSMDKKIGDWLHQVNCFVF